MNSESPSPIKEEEGEEMDLMSGDTSVILALLDGKLRGEGTVAGRMGMGKITMPPLEVKKKMPRFRMEDGGFAFRFDKNSTCGTRKFWRCERKQECTARIHTDMEGNVIKRINFHTHSAIAEPGHVHIPKKRVEQPKQLRARGISQPAASPLATLPTHSIFTCALTAGLPYSQDDKVLFSGGSLRDSASPNDETAMFSGLLEAFVKEGESAHQSIKNEDEEMRAGTSELSVQLPVHNGLIPGKSEGADESPEFWRTFELTKRFYAIVKKEIESGQKSVDVEFVHEDVQNFVHKHHLKSFSAQLHRYSMTELRLLSVEECKDVLESTAEGVRMYHAIRSHFGISNEFGCGSKKEEEKCENVSSLPSIRIYIASSDEPDPIFKMVTLPSGARSLHTLKESLVRRGVLQGMEMSRLCINEGRMTVELCDEIMEEWTVDQVLKYRRSDDYVIFEKSQTR
ncbi:hypothetical protein PFISCL1PPCAC_9405 [Pristionchus fissidentatus]|uniref:FLYWCH-type domain-containing protein n=1 Tax=Pristionchus fissidentatus TaxID=1538716 RepID=A0AAV5VFN3_9BILA|nr:hypothetical protein PFISCL1PPCAC_9405 [Pristionchus fissidentatus]